MNHTKELKDKVNKAKKGWDYLWNLLEKEAIREKHSSEVLTILFRYQVELDAAKHKLDNYQMKLENVTLTKEDEEIVKNGLANYMSTFQAIVFSIGNLLRE